MKYTSKISEKIVTFSKQDIVWMIKSARTRTYIIKEDFLTKLTKLYYQDLKKLIFVNGIKFSWIIWKKMVHWVKEQLSKLYWKSSLIWSLLRNVKYQTNNLKTLWYVHMKSNLKKFSSIILSHKMFGKIMICTFTTWTLN